jgi:hypothetical protein
MEEFLGYKNEEESCRDLTSAEEEFPAAELWKRSQTFWVHPKISKLLDLNTPQRAGKLAIEIMRALPVNIPNQDHLDYGEAVASSTNDIPLGGRKPLGDNSIHPRCTHF